MRKAIISRLGLAAMAVVLAQPLASAETTESRTSYSITLLGLPIAALDFTTELKGRDYHISGQIGRAHV